jgi:predicted DNA-binding protein
MGKEIKITETASDISWALIGVRSHGEAQLTEEEANEMLKKSFGENASFSLFLCGKEVDEEGSLEDMENGFKLLRENMEDYKHGDYAIISKHELADLLFMPVDSKELEALQEEAGKDA